MKETWRTVVGYPMYEVSDLGRIRRMSPGCATSVGRVLSGAAAMFGYRKVTLAKSTGRYATLSVHSVVARAFIGPRPTSRPHINHKNGIKTDNRLSNLEYTSMSENIRHRIQVLGVKTWCKGERIHQAKLTESQVKAIRAAPDIRGMRSRLSRELGVSPSLVSMIRSGVVWKHVV